MNFVNLDDLYTPHIQRDKNKLRHYDVIFAKVIRKINKTNKDLKQMECLYRVPPYDFGGPIYNYDELKRYLKFKLFENGIKAEYIDGETIYISWKPEDIDRERYQNKLTKVRDKIDKKYNVSESKIREKLIKHKKTGKDNVTQEISRIGVLQYNEKINDLVPINPKKLNKYKPLDGFPTMDRENLDDAMTHFNPNQEKHSGDYLANGLQNYVNRGQLQHVPYVPQAQYVPHVPQPQAQQMHMQYPVSYRQYQHQPRARGGYPQYPNPQYPNPQH